MNQSKTVENRVLEILKDCPRSRYDDMLLILHYYNRYSYMRVGELPLEDIVFNYKLYGLPCFETIRRARQRVQSVFPELSRNPQQNNATFQNKVKVLNKLFDAGCDTEKKLQQLDMAAILKIPNITIPDMTLIMEFQKQTKSGKLFSYLGGGADEQRTDGQAHHME